MRLATDKYKTAFEPIREPIREVRLLIEEAKHDGHTVMGEIELCFQNGRVTHVKSRADDFIPANHGLVDMSIESLTDRVAQVVDRAAERLLFGVVRLQFVVLLGGKLLGLRCVREKTEKIEATPVGEGSPVRRVR